MNASNMSPRRPARPNVRPVTAIVGGLAILLTAIAAQPAPGAIVVDGHFDPSEGYTSGYSVNFLVEGGGVATGGKLWLHQDATSYDLFLALILPRTLVDNSYGVNAIGWPGDNHKFDHLRTSDKGQFIFTDAAGDTLLDMTMDYLTGFGLNAKGKPDKKLPPFASGGVTADDGTVTTGSESDVLAAESSMGYNYAAFGTSHPQLFGKDSYSPAADSNYNVSDPALAAWDFDVTYEFQVAGTALGGSSFDPESGTSIEGLHISPIKDCPKETPGVVPEPSTIVIWSLLATLGITVVWRRRSVA